MEGVTITFSNVDELSFKSKKGKIVVQFETLMTPGDIGRLVNLQKQSGGTEIRAMIVSPQARLDLRFEGFDTLTGEKVKG